MDVTISLAQITPFYGKPKANLEQAAAQAEEAARRGSQILLLPELWTTGYDLSNARLLAQENADLLPELAKLARTQRLALGGSLLLEEDGKVYNTFVFIPTEDSVPARYSKIHLFRLMDEDRWLAPGQQVKRFSALWGETALAICYDLRFPELFRRYALEGAELVLVCAEWPAARIAHWQTLLKARAIENQCFFAGVNAVGECGGETFGGRSAVISPWGEALVEGSAEEGGLYTAQIQLDQVKEARERIPIFKDRRPDLYR